MRSTFHLCLQEGTNKHLKIYKSHDSLAPITLSWLGTPGAHSILPFTYFTIYIYKPARIVLAYTLDFTLYSHIGTSTFFDT